MKLDRVITNPFFYRGLMENDRVRVLEYRDASGDRTTPHSHPDSVMYTLTSFRRGLAIGDRAVDREIEAGSVMWLASQEHFGENVGDTPTHVIFVELKEDGATASTEAELGPTPAH